MLRAARGAVRRQYAVQPWPRAAVAVRRLTTGWASSAAPHPRAAVQECLSRLHVDPKAPPPQLYLWFSTMPRWGEQLAQEVPASSVGCSALPFPSHMVDMPPTLSVTSVHFGAEATVVPFFSNDGCMPDFGRHLPDMVKGPPPLFLSMSASGSRSVAESLLERLARAFTSSYTVGASAMTKHPASSFVFGAGEWHGSGVAGVAVVNARVGTPQALELVRTSFGNALVSSLFVDRQLSAELFHPGPGRWFVFPRQEENGALSTTYRAAPRVAATPAGGFGHAPLQVLSHVVVNERADEAEPEAAEEEDSRGEYGEEEEEEEGEAAAASPTAARSQPPAPSASRPRTAPTRPPRPPSTALDPPVLTKLTPAMLRAPFMWGDDTLDDCAVIPLFEMSVVLFPGCSLPMYVRSCLRHCERRCLHRRLHRCLHRCLQCCLRRVAHPAAPAAPACRHIFESRFRLMLRDVLRNGSLFGVIVRGASVGTAVAVEEVIEMSEGGRCGRALVRSAPVRSAPGPDHVSVAPQIADQSHWTAPLLGPSLPAPPTRRRRQRAPAHATRSQLQNKWVRRASFGLEVGRVRYFDDEDEAGAEVRCWAALAVASRAAPPTAAAAGGRRQPRRHAHAGGSAGGQAEGQREAHAGRPLRGLPPHHRLPPHPGLALAANRDGCWARAPGPFSLLFLVRPPLPPCLATAFSDTATFVAIAAAAATTTLPLLPPRPHCRCCCAGWPRSQARRSSDCAGCSAPAP